MGNVNFDFSFKVTITQLQMQFSRLSWCKLGHVWVRWKALFKSYLFSVPLFWFRSSKKLPAAERIVQKRTKFGWAVLKVLTGAEYHGKISTITGEIFWFFPVILDYPSFRNGRSLTLTPGELLYWASDFWTF